MLVNFSTKLSNIDFNLSSLSLDNSFSFAIASNKSLWLALISFKGSIWQINILSLLIWGYSIRFLAVSKGGLDAGFERISPRIDDVARSLKTSGWNLLSKVHVPLLKTSFLTSMLLVVAEVIKELPATLILRPFNFDTLAVSTYIYAAEERMYDAAAPSISIVLVGLIPIIILTRLIRTSRPASRDS